MLSHKIIEVPLPVRYEATYQAERDVFLRMADRALHHTETGTPLRWQVDGSTSDRLFLRMYSDPSALEMGWLDQELALDVGTVTVTVAINTRSEGTLRFFRRFTAQLDVLLLRQDA
ncbi:hypothetical protein SU48_01575 [Deinococcus puniceus]|uniref:Uncharacterized protein n=1 Tax=Deinococcus puniceus TaxID=1182568 RepID=A0A172T6Q2_9DEIO|nr:hypothetical protein SU48_01575 [Deinococcus puniceus]